MQVFLTDNRWYRNAQDRLTGARSYLGDAQIEWLIDALKSSPAPFKFVVVGGQVLNTAVSFENYATYGEERARLLDRITTERIPGVLFLRGDKHWTELSRMPRRAHTLFTTHRFALTSAPPIDEGRKQRNRVDGPCCRSTISACSRSPVRAPTGS